MRSLDPMVYTTKLRVKYALLVMCKKSDREIAFFISKNLLEDNDKNLLDFLYGIPIMVQSSKTVRGHNKTAYAERKTKVPVPSFFCIFTGFIYIEIHMSREKKKVPYGVDPRDREMG